MVRSPPPLAMSSDAAERERFKYLKLGGREFRLPLFFISFWAWLLGPPFFFFYFTMNIRHHPPFLAHLFSILCFLYICTRPNNHQLSKLGPVVGHLACNPRVRGSNPGAPTFPFFFFLCFLCLFSFFLFLSFFF